MKPNFDEMSLVELVVLNAVMSQPAGLESVYDKMRGVFGRRLLENERPVVLRVLERLVKDGHVERRCDKESGDIYLYKPPKARQNYLCDE